MKDFIKVALVCAVAAGMGGCGDDSDTPFSTTPGQDAYGYPTAPDAFDATGNANGVFAGATPIVLGQTYRLSIFPVGDVDYVKVPLVAGTAYEFSVNKICATCDVRIYLFDEAEAAIDDDDDYIDYDSRVLFTPATSGTYYLRVQPYDSVGLSNFQLNVHEFVDADSDGYSSYYDCDDNNATIYPDATDVSGDGIDQDCTGTDAPVATNPDAFEVDNAPATAKLMKVSPYGDYESLFIFRSLSGEDRTIHDGSDEDWVKMEVPPFGGYDPTYENFTGSITMALFEADGTTPATDIVNTTASPKTFYARYTGTAGSIYIPYFEFIGVDRDGDSYFTQDWDTDRDCNDADAAINPGATEVTGNDVDEDCDGVAQP